MAVGNKISMSTIGGGGSSSGTKKKNTISTSYSDNLLGGGISNPQISLPQNLLYRDNLVNLQPVGGAGAGTGGVTSEGVILGNPNVERMPQIKEKTDTSYSANLLNAAAQQPTTPMTYGQQLAAASAQQETPATGTPDTSGGTDTTGSTGSTGGSTTGSGEVDTYEEFLLKQEGFYKEQLDKLNAQIEQNKQNALQQAESERERAVIDARSSYAQNLATYGANAEQLAAMGLSGSGYSDYLTQQAYATQRAETQNANAQAEATKVAAEQQANSDKLNAELSYAENMQNNAEKLAQYQQQKAEEAKAEEEQKKAYYASLLASANSGEFSSEQIAAIATQYGLDEAQISQLQAAADKFKSSSFAEVYRTESENIQNQGSYYDTSYLDMLLKNGDIDQETYNGLMKQYADVVAEESDSETLDNLHEEGKIDDATYQSKIDEWNKDIDTSTAFFNGADYTAGKQAYEEVVNNPWATEETKAKLKASYLRTYAEDIARELVGDSVTGGVVDINSGSYNAKQWGDYNDIGDPDSGQGQLISRFVADAKAGKIKEGQVITVNYGQVWSDYGVYVYVGDGVFVKCKNSARNDYEKYTPSGYKYGGINGSIRK